MGSTSDALEYPKLRPVEAFPVSLQKRQMICLRDPQYLAPESMLLTHGAFFIVSCFNGAESLQDIQAAYFRRFGERVSREKIQELVRMLDENSFLDTQAFHAARELRMEEFRRQSVRTAIHAGAAYEADPKRLRQQIDSFFAHSDGIGMTGTLAGTDSMCGLITPHIDFHRGGPTYSWAYGSLRNRQPHDLYVLFGTSHSPLPHPFCLTLKDFETPLGRVKTAGDLVNEISRQHQQDLLDGEWVHRYEHSIEFQVIFLQYLFPASPLKILPVLCGNIFRIEEGPLMDISVEADRFLQTLAKVVKEWAGQVFFIAGADLAHMGPRFGDRSPVDTELLSWLRASDLRLLEKVERLDIGGFLEEIRQEGDARRICGISAIYSLLSACGARLGKLLRYGQSPDPEGTQVVSYASMAFY